MNFTANVNVLKNPQGSLRAFATLIVNDVLSVDGFRIIEGSKGTFVAAPSEKSNKVDEQTGKPVYFDKVRFLEDREEGAFRGPVQEQAYGVILTAYAQAKALDNRQASAQTERVERTNDRPNTGNKTRTPVQW